MAETLIEREEVVALLFNVADIALTARALAGYLTGEDDGEVEEEDE